VGRNDSLFCRRHLLQAVHVHLATTIGFVLQRAGTTVYFAGDTYYRPFMAQVGNRFPLDAALLPVTTYRIPMTMGEAGAVQAVKALNAPVVIPIHQALQPRSPLLRTRQSVDGFARKLAEADLQTTVIRLEPGEAWTLTSPPNRC
jgi:L-ascorbate metabolism protein UlaG (beta-lactamase superfamily)